MRRGTTPTITCELEDFDLDHVDKVIFTIRQDSYVINKETTVDFEHSTVSVTLTQKESLGLRCGNCAVQIKFLVGEEVLATDIVEVEVEQILNEEVIADENNN